MAAKIAGVRPSLRRGAIMIAAAEQRLRRTRLGGWVAAVVLGSMDNRSKRFDFPNGRGLRQGVPVLRQKRDCLHGNATRRSSTKTTSTRHFGAIGSM